MTRKEPQFGDDTSAATLSSAPIEAPLKPREAQSSSQTPKPQAAATTTPWLLWLLVLLSLAASFGMAFFGLEEAGRYQAALAKAQEQATVLEETISRLNQSQSQGIGELAQSDAQMRQSLAALEKRLQADVTEELTAFKQSQAALNQAVASLGETVPKLERSVSNLTAKSDEQLALLAEQLNAQRTRVDDLTGQGARVAELTEQTASMNSELQSIVTQMSTSDATMKQVSDQMALLDTNLSSLRTEVESLAASSSNVLGIELLSEQVDRLSEQVTQQGQLLEAVDASRRQLTQRLIDLDDRVNLALQPRE